MKILNESIVFPKESIEKIEETYRAKYVCDSSLKTKDGGWSYQPAAVFYQPHPPPEMSNYFGMYVYDKDVMICKADSATEPFDGIVADNGDVIYSRFRHDYRGSPDNSVFVDGGREYTRWGGKDLNITRLVKINVVGPDLVIDK